MAIGVQHGPSMIEYGQAVQQSSARITSNDRMEQYATYLAGLQKANQDFSLGLMNLGQDQQRIGLQGQALDIDKFKAQLQEAELKANIAGMRDQNYASIVNAQASRNRSNADILGAMGGYGYSGYSYF